MDFHNLTNEKCLEELKSNKNGLNSQEVVLLQQKYGYNRLPQKKKKNRMCQFLSQFCDIMIIILFVAAAISITVAIVQKQSSEIIDGIIILAIVLINAVIGFVQELRAEKEMNALLVLSEQETKVIRDGEHLKILCHELTIGDIVVLEAGDIVPADIRLIETANLKCDESSLTGESHSVEKDAKKLCDIKTPLAERVNMAFKGSVVTNGRGLGVVADIGEKTELGKIASILAQTEKDLTPLQKNIKSVGKIITFIVLFVASLTFLLEILAKPNGSIMEAFLTAVAISVAAIPESLPAVITIIMSMGVSKLSKKKAIVRRLHVIETLGSTEIICSDKTGTLTQNVMTVVSLFYNNKYVEKAKNESSYEFLTLLKTMTLCNDSVKNKKGYVGDPTETALTTFAEKCGLSKTQAELENSRVGEIPFDSIRKLMTTVNMNNGQLVSYTKGAPDIIIKRCSKVLIDGQIVDLNENYKKEILEANKTMASSALRVLGCAVSKLDYTKNEVPTDEIRENDLIFVGLIGMIDPPRKEAKLAVEKCRNAKMTPIMITGDHKSTALAIAKDIGIAENDGQVLTGAELDELSEADYINIIHNIKVYARVSPENKVRIVKTYKMLGKIVAMTGDGVNDAPSIKTADIGIGMGITGTDVTKEVADMIVCDDNFATIVVAVEEGRRIYSNIKKTMGFLFAANMAEILSLLFATIIFPSLTFLLPVQILFVNLITDSMPAIALGLEHPEKDIMTKPPRQSGKSIFANGVGLNICIMGIIQTIGIVLCFLFGMLLTNNNIVATTMAFFGLNFIQLFYLLSARVDCSFFKSNPFQNKMIWVSIGISLLIIGIFAFTPLGAIIGLCYLSAIQWLIILGCSIIILPLSELLKYVIKKMNNKKRS